MACIYALSSSLDPDVVRYVGRSKADCGESRLEHHLWETRRGTRSHKCNWINSVWVVGGAIVTTVLESGLTYAESTVREIFYIAHYRDMGSLTNMTDGGEGAVGAVQSDEHRTKISEALTGRAFSAEHRAALSVAQTGKKHSDETLAKMSESHKGKPLSLEHRAKLSVASSRPRQPHTAERCANMSAATKGKKRKPHTAEARANMVVAQRKRRLA